MILPLNENKLDSTKIKNEKPVEKEVIKPKEETKKE